MAFAETAQAEVHAAPGAMGLDGFYRVAGATRVEPTPGSQERAECYLIYPEATEEDFFHVFCWALVINLSKEASKVFLSVCRSAWAILGLHNTKISRH